MRTEFPPIDSMESNVCSQPATKLRAASCSIRSVSNTDGRAMRHATSPPHLQPRTFRPTTPGKSSSWISEADDATRYVPVHAFHYRRRNPGCPGGAHPCQFTSETCPSPGTECRRRGRALGDAFRDAKSTRPSKKTPRPVFFRPSNRQAACCGKREGWFVPVADPEWIDEGRRRLGNPLRSVGTGCHWSSRSASGRAM